MESFLVDKGKHKKDRIVLDLRSGAGYKESTCRAGDEEMWIPCLGQEKSLGVGNGNPLQCS